jgi:PAS domain S-box-containing protein
MNASVVGTDQLPFPAVITKGGLIETCNRSFVDSILHEESGVGKNLKNLFDEWAMINENKAIATQNNKHYIIFQCDLCSEDLTIYVLFDGTDDYQLQQKVKNLNKLNRELDALIENSYDSIYITDREGTTLKTNSAIERITGIPKHYYIGKNVKNLVKRGILLESTTLKVLKEGKPVTIVQRNFAGKETMLTGSPIFNEKGEIEKVVTNIRDLSELNVVHNELKKVQTLNDQYKKEIEQLKTQRNQNPGIILKSEKMKDIFEVADRIANVDTTVLLLGETGVGKDVLARNIYKVSNRYKKGKFIKVNCGAIPNDLLESELFGYEAGAFTGANRSGKAGMFEMADQGILFLDEVAELPLSLQVKLLRVLQEKEVSRIGATKPKNVDVRVIAATNRNLEEMIQRGEFREDLFYRLHVLPFYIPPLRERKNDILPLVHYFLEESNRKYQFKKRFAPSLLDFFFHYKWPGNVRELANLIERLVLTVLADEIMIDDLPKEYCAKRQQTTPTLTKITPLKKAVESAEKEVLTLAVQECTTTYEIAEKLASSQATVVRKLQKYNIKSPHAVHSQKAMDVDEGILK